MRKFVVGAIAVTSLAAGSAAMAVTNPLGVAGAQGEPGTTAPAPPSTDPAAPSTTVAPSDGDGPKRERPEGDHKGERSHGRLDGKNMLTDTLAELVANGTITQAQADAIVQAMKDNMPAPGDKGDRGPGKMDGMFDVIAAAIGIDTQTLMTEMRSGKSLAEVATAHGVDPQRVIDSIVATLTAQIDAAVAAGRVPADRAEKMKSEVAQHAADMVNGKFGGRGGHKGHHDDDDADDDAGDDDDDAGDDHAAEPPATTAPATPSTQAPPTTAPSSTPPATEAAPSGTTVS